MKFFSTAGAIHPEDHYFISHRLDIAKLKQLIEQKKYFIIHGPRQSGKTTGILEVVTQLNLEGKYKAFYINVEAAQAARNNLVEGLRTILNRFKTGIDQYFPDNDPSTDYLRTEVNNPTLSGNALYDFLQFWARNSEKSLVIFIDEIDSLVGDTLISVLRQLRDGYTIRPDFFPQSICLVGVRDVRDYRIWSDADQHTILGGSAFNIKAESLVLFNFTPEQVRDLYLQHTHETGQHFTDDAINHAYYLTQGQPWLVNALAYEACFVDVTDPLEAITIEVIERAKETLIRRCDTHLDVLIDRLQEPRVRNIMDAIIGGQSDLQTFIPDDIQYIRDLGLIKPDGFDIANPIYQEIIPRALALTAQEQIREKSAFYHNPDGTLNMNKLLAAFTEFYRENSTSWLADFPYKESGPHLLLMAFLQRIVNGGGTIHREYALDRKRVDLLLCRGTQRVVIELKVKRDGKTLTEGLLQTAEYMDIANAAEGHLVLFDRDLEKNWDKKIYHWVEQVENKTINVWGM